MGNKKAEEYIKTHNLENTGSNTATLGEYMDSWMLNFKRNELKPQSYDRLDCTIRIHIKPEIGYLDMQSITTKDIKNLLNKKYKEESLSYSSVKKIHDALNACFEFNLALSPQERILSYNPCRAAVIPGKQKENSVKEKHFTEEETLKIKEVVDSVDEKGRKIYPYGAAYIFLLNTGLRLSEFAALDKSDIDFENKCVFIHKNFTVERNRDEKGELTGSITQSIAESVKTRSGNRKVLLNKNALDAAKELVNLRPDKEYLVTARTGNRATPYCIEKTFKSILKSCGLDGDRTVHSLRHTFASILIKNNVDAKTVSELLGHSSVKVTLDIYTHIFADQKLNAVNSIPEI